MIRATSSLLVVALAVPAAALAQDVPPPVEQPPVGDQPPPADQPPAVPPIVEQPPPVADEPPPEPEPVEIAPFTTNIYGYIDTQFHELAFAGGFADNSIAQREVREENDIYAVNLNVMFQGHLFQRYHWFLNFGATNAADIAEGDSSIGIRNAWVEVPLWRDRLILRAGKTYRRFGLYNEILDAAPTFPGVEAPEFLVRGQLLLTRTTNIMLHGVWLNGENRLMYTLHTGSDERADTQVPIGGDLRYAIGDSWLIGSSGYWTGGAARPTRTVGAGQPEGGVINWMTTDEYVVFGGYLQLRRNALLVQVEYWRAMHDAKRNPFAVEPLGDLELNERQCERFFNGVADPMPSDVNIDAEYEVQTAWARFAYDLAVGAMGTFTPYLHIEWYSHPEAIEGAALGGNEAGLSDDGQFFRSALGFAYRPVPQVALKTEINPHFQIVDDAWTVIAPFQISFSYYWKLEVAE